MLTKLIPVLEMLGVFADFPKFDFCFPFFRCFAVRKKNDIIQKRRADPPPTAIPIIGSAVEMNNVTKRKFMAYFLDYILLLYINMYTIVFLVDMHTTNASYINFWRRFCCQRIISCRCHGV